MESKHLLQFLQTEISLWLFQAWGNSCHSLGRQKIDKAGKAES
jgi:hypothetical protein